jgi:hypothetical protein
MIYTELHAHFLFLCWMHHTTTAVVQMAAVVLEIMYTRSLFQHLCLTLFRAAIVDSQNADILEGKE